MLKGLLIVFAFLVIGKAIEQALSLPVPGSIVGMILLIGMQFAIPSLHDAIKDIAQIFQRYLALIYFPLGVVVVLDHQPLIQDWLSVVLAITLATAIALVIIAFLASWLFRPKKPLSNIPVETNIPIENKGAIKSKQDYIDNGEW